MTTTNDALPAQLLFEPDGHLTEVALACLGDGQLDLLPAPLHAHLDDCERCARRLGEAALLSVATGDALRELPIAVQAAALAPAHAPAVAVSGVRRRRPFPMAAIAAALALAALTAGPSLLDAARGMPSAIAAVPFLVHVAGAFVRAPWGIGPTALLIKGVSALLLAAVGLQVARITSRSRSWQQGGV